MRIAFVVSGIGRGGAERQLVQLAGGLTSRGHDVTVLSAQTGEFGSELLAANVPLEIVGGGGQLGWVYSKFRLVGAVRRANPQIVHPYLTSTNTWVTLLRPLMGRRLLVWGVRDSGTDPRLYGLRARLVFAAARRASRSADLIVANSNAGAANCAALGYPAQRITVIPNGIDTDVFRPNADARLVHREMLGAHSSDRVVGMLARYDPVKGHEDFVAAAGLASRSTDDAMLFAIAGDHPADKRRLLEAAAAEAGIRLVIQPAQQEPQGFLNALDVLVMPSRLAEGFPNVIGEAFACGTTVVATDVGDSRMLVEGRGIVVEPSRPDLLASAMLNAIAAAGDPAAAVERRRFIVENYSIDRLVQRTEEVLERLISERAATR